MAARTALHLSYIAEDAAQGGVRNPAAPLAELLAFLDDAHGLAGGESSRPWYVRHALQPFAAVYFEQAAAAGPPDPALRSFAVAYAQTRGAGAAAPGPAPLLPPAATLAPPPDADGNSLAQLRAFLRRPAQATARQMLGVALPDADDAADADEPLTPHSEPRRRVPAQLLDHALARGQTGLPTQAPDWLARSGLLPAGAIGALAWRDLRAGVAAALELLHGHPCAQAPEVDVDCSVRLDDGYVLGGSVTARRDADGRYWLLRVETRKTLDFSVRLPLWLDRAALALSLPAAQLGGCMLLHLHGGCAEIDALAANASSDATLLRAGIAQLCALRSDVLRARRWYFPATAWAVAEAPADARYARARGAWSGSQAGVGERDHAPGYAALLTRGRDWIDEPQAWRDFVAQALALAALLGLQTQEPADA
jgi:exodeoxyribonuclease V gamma subunit